VTGLDILRAGLGHSSGSPYEAIKLISSGKTHYFFKPKVYNDTFRPGNSMLTPKLKEKIFTYAIIWGPALFWDTGYKAVPGCN
jgi:hypothetical protein